MWPFEARVRRSLVGVSRLARVDVTGTVTSPDDVSAPFSGLRAAFVWIQLTESPRLTGRGPRPGHAEGGADIVHLDDDRVLGAMVLGDTLVVRADDGGEVVLCPRTARVVLARSNPQRAESTGAVTTTPPEPSQLVQLAARASGGALSYREVGLRQGSRVRLRAFVEPAARIAHTAYRSVAKPSFVVREDAGPVELVEVVTTR